MNAYGRLVAALLTLLASFAVTAQRNTSGTLLCVAGEACRPYTCGMKIDASAKSRPYFVRKESTFYLDRAAAGSDAIACGVDPHVTFRILLPDRVSARSVTVHVADGNDLAWTLTIPKSDLKEPIRIGARPAVYHVSVQATGFFPWKRDIDLRNPPAEIGIRLLRWPTVSGTVLAGVTGVAVAGAIVTTDVPNSSVVFTTSAGRFEIEADPDKWPTTINVTAAAYAETHVPVPPAHTSAMLTAIYLHRGGRLTVEVEEAKPVGIRAINLLKSVPHRQQGTPLRTVDVSQRRLEDGATRVDFDALEPGQYEVIAAGREPWERCGEVIGVQEGETTSVRLKIDPLDIHFATTADGHPLSDARIELISVNKGWQATLAMDENGEKQVTVWQGGKLRCGVVSKSFTLPFLTERTISESGDWPIDVPLVEIKGVVIDSDSDEPVRNAKLSIRVAGAQPFLINTDADEQGRFRIAPVPYGETEINAAARNYPPGGTRIVLHEPDRSAEVTIRLRRASPVHVTLLDNEGRPVGGALLIEAGVRRTAVRTDGMGLADVPLLDGTSAQIFVVPPQGSFGVFALSRDTADATFRLLPSLSRLVVRTQSDTAEPIMGMAMIIRYNGTLLPAEVMAELGRVRAMSNSTGPDGRVVFDRMPVGVYEFWPIAGPRDYVTKSATLSDEPAARIVAGPGEYTATMTFVAKSGAP